MRFPGTPIRETGGRRSPPPTPASELSGEHTPSGPLYPTGPRDLCAFPPDRSRHISAGSTSVWTEFLFSSFENSVLHGWCLQALPGGEFLAPAAPPGPRGAAPERGLLGSQGQRETVALHCSLSLLGSWALSCRPARRCPASEVSPGHTEFWGRRRGTQWDELTLSLSPALLGSRSLRDGLRAYLCACVCACVWARMCVSCPVLPCCSVR